MRKRNHRVVVYFDDEEFLDLTTKVQKSRLAREEVIRRAVKGIAIQEAPPADVPLLIRELRRIGGNLNQLAVVANTRGFIDAPQLRNALERNRAIEKLVVDAYTGGGR